MWILGDMDHVFGVGKIKRLKNDCHRSPQENSLFSPQCKGNCPGFGALAKRVCGYGIGFATKIL